jgi:hypothetical protein
MRHRSIFYVSGKYFYHSPLALKLINVPQLWAIAQERRAFPYLSFIAF